VNENHLTNFKFLVTIPNSMKCYMYNCERRYLYISVSIYELSCTYVRIYQYEFMNVLNVLCIYILYV